jgi:SAM-dependent methyltransferase
VEWVEPFYTQKPRWLHALGMPLDVLAHDRARVAIIRELRGPEPLQILDLGCGDGGTAAALADAGHDVVGIEISSLRVQHARQLAADPRAGCSGEERSYRVCQQLPLACGLKPAMKIGASRLFSGEYL